MPNIDRHAPGSFCWIELGTSDQAAAKSFYSSLFNWAVNDFPMGPGQFYSMFTIEGRNTGAAYTLDPKNMPGIPPNWALYVCVESADAAAAKAGENGGKVLGGPFDVYEFGRMAVLQDPTGAIFNVWQPLSHHGTGIYGVPGTLCWADLSTPDADAAKLFYENVFGWKVTPGEKDTSGYLHIQNGDHYIGGIPPAQYRNPNAPPHWLIYFHVDDADAATAKAKELGARVYMEPMTMEGVGRWSVVADPQGAVFALFQPPADHK
jgi:predicted enzyme related to lactoylglutathione lyase